MTAAPSPVPPTRPVVSPRKRAGRGRRGDPAFAVATVERARGGHDSDTGPAPGYGDRGENARRCAANAPLSHAVNPAHFFARPSLEECDPMAHASRAPRYCVRRLARPGTHHDAHNSCARPALGTSTWQWAANAPLLHSAGSASAANAPFWHSESGSPSCASARENRDSWTRGSREPRRSPRSPPRLERARTVVTAARGPARGGTSTATRSPAAIAQQLA
jgi:hypothetical protein